MGHLGRRTRRKVVRDGAKKNGMAAEGFRLMAEGRMVGWNELAKLVDGAVVQVLGNMHGGMGKKSRTRGESDDGSGVPSWAQEVPWSDYGSRAVRRKNSSRPSRRMN